MKAVAVASPAHLETTGNCYCTAANYILDEGTPQMVLVHGRPTLQRSPFCQYGHAWIEDGEICIDGNTLDRIPKFLYYALGQIDEDLSLRYTKEQVRRFVLDFLHYGPWEGVDGTPPSDE